MKGTMMIANRYSRWSVRARLWTTILLALAWTQLASAQRAFETPEAAAQAVVEAAKANDENALIDIFGAKYRSLVATVDHAADQANREKFARAAAEHLVLRPDGDN